jgi:hypothetical protein
MFCSACGQQLQPNQQACPKCGRPVAGAIPSAPMQPQTYPPVPVPYVSRVQRHIQTLGVLWLVYAGWLLLTWAFAATFMTAFFGGMGHHRWGPMGPGPFGSGFPFAGIPWLIPFITIILIARSALGLLTGIALLRRERWGRPLAIVVGVLALLRPLTGTLLGIYTLWVLLPAESAQEYDQIST